MKLDWKQVREGQWEAHAKGRRVSFGVRVVTADERSSKFYAGIDYSGPVPMPSWSEFGNEAEALVSELVKKLGEGVDEEQIEAEWKARVAEAEKALGLN